MLKKEALRVLGLAGEATTEEVRGAFRSLQEQTLEEARIQQSHFDAELKLLEDAFLVLMGAAEPFTPRRGSPGSEAGRKPFTKRGLAVTVLGVGLVCCAVLAIGRVHSISQSPASSINVAALDSMEVQLMLGRHTPPQAGGISAEELKTFETQLEPLAKRGDAAVTCLLCQVRLEDARILGSHLKLADAFVLAHQLGEAQPDSAEAHFALGLTMLAAEQKLVALQHLRRAVELRPTWDQPRIELAALNQNLGNIDEAEKLLQEIEEPSPAFAVASKLQGDIHYARKDYGAARECFTAATKSQSDWVVPYYDLAYVERLLDKPEEARKLFAAARQLGPKWARPYYGQAELETDQQHYDRAKQLYLEAIELDPTWPEPYVGLGVMYHLQGDLDNAKIEYALACKLDPTNSYALINLGMLELEDGKVASARHNFEAALSHSLPGDGVHEAALRYLTTAE
jgi:Flp pilus assembly protein TadD